MANHVVPAEHIPAKSDNVRACCSNSDGSSDASYVHGAASLPRPLKRADQ